MNEYVNLGLIVSLAIVCFSSMISLRVKSGAVFVATRDAVRDSQRRIKGLEDIALKLHDEVELTKGLLTAIEDAVFHAPERAGKNKEDKDA